MRKGFLIDMDGVIYRGSHVFDGAVSFINELLDKEIPFLFLTNNSRHTRRDMALKLNRLGFPVEEHHFFTSAMATGRFLASQRPNGTAYVLGEGGLVLALHRNGYTIVDHTPDFVVVGEGRTLTLEMVEKAIDFILDGAKLIATNLDPSPKIKGWTKPGTAAIVSMLEAATHSKAFSVGKPSPVMLRAARLELGLSADGTTIIGDTMETDILGGVWAGYRTVLVLTGWSQRPDLAKYAYAPDLVFNSVADFNLPDLLEEMSPNGVRTYDDPIDLRCMAR
jgi:NagD protein